MQRIEMIKWQLTGHTAGRRGGGNLSGHGHGRRYLPTAVTRRADERSAEKLIPKIR